MGGNHRPLARALAALFAAALMLVPSAAIADGIIDQPGVVQAGTIEGAGQSSSTDEGQSQNGPGSSGSSSSTSTCVLPFRGDCLFQFDEDRAAAANQSDNATWRYYDLQNETRNGAYVNVMDGVVFAKVDAMDTSHQTRSDSGSQSTDDNYRYYDNNLGYSEEHVDNQTSQQDAFSQTSDTVSGYEGTAGVNAGVVQTNTSTRQVDSQSSSSSGSDSSSSSDKSDSYFGVPIYGTAAGDQAQAAQESAQRLKETLVDSEVFLVNPIDNTRTEIIGLHFSDGQSQSSGSSSSESHHTNSLSVFGFDAYKQEDRSRNEGEYALFEQWLDLVVDVGNGTVKGGFAYDKGTSYVYNSTYDSHQTDVVGVPIYGTEKATENETSSQWRRVDFSLDALHGVANVGAQQWEQNDSSRDSHQDTTYIFGMPVGTQGDSTSTAHTDGLSFGAAVLGGLLTLSAGYENESQTSHSANDFILGTPLVGTRSDDSSSSRTLGAGVGVLDGGAGVAYEEGSSASNDQLLIGDNPLFGLDQSESHHSYSADAAVPMQVLVFHLKYEKSSSHTALDLAGFPMGIDGQQESFDTGVGGSVPNPIGPGSLLVYGFDHKETHSDYDLVMGNSTIGGFEHNESSNHLNVMVMNGDLLNVQAKRQFSDSHFFAGNHTEIIDASGQSVSGSASVAGMDIASASVFFGYLEFANAIALGIVVATYCVAPDTPVPLDDVIGTVGGIAPPQAGPVFTAAALAVMLAMLAKCGLPVVAPLPLFLLSPCILVPVAHALVFEVAGPLAVALLPNPVDDLAGLAVDNGGSVSWDAYQTALGCVWFTLPTETRNPQPVLTGADAADQQAQPVIDQVWPHYDSARYTAYQLMDLLFGTPDLVPPPGSVLIVPADPCAAGGLLCAADPDTCVAAGARVTIPSQGIDDLRGRSHAARLALDQHAAQAAGPASAVGSRCDGGNAPDAPVCAQAWGANVSVDLRPSGAPLAVSALGVSDAACQRSASDSDMAATLSDVSVNVSAFGFRPIGPLQRATLLLGPFGMVSFDEAFAHDDNGCIHRYGDALRAVSFDGNAVSGQVVLSSVSTIACRTNVTATTSGPMSPPPPMAPGTAVHHSVTIAGDGPTPTGTVTFRLCGPTESTPGGCPTGGALVGAVKHLSSGSATSDDTNATRDIGVYCWRADYHGDANYAPASITNATDCFQTVPQPVTIALDALPNGSNVSPASFVRAAVNVSGSPRPTGNVTFYLCSPAESTIGGCPSGGALVGTTPLNVTAHAFSPETNATNSVGTYCWRAEYAGDVQHTPGSATSGAACFATGAQGTSLVLSALPTGSVATGTSTNASVRVLGRADAPTPTGNVVFRLCDPTVVVNASCPAGTLIGTVALDVFGNANSPSTSATQVVGKYCWRAEYGGDAYYLPNAIGTGACFTTLPRTPVLSIAPTPSGTVAPGVLAHASATVTGTGPAPTGTVAFFLCSPSDVTLAQGCPSPSGTLVSAAAPLVAGTATSANTNATNGVGRLCWRAAYSGDANYAPGTLTNNASACFTTARQTPTLTGTSAPTGTNIVPGVNVTASVVVTGTGGTPTGRVRFFLCDPTNVTVGTGCVAPNGVQVGVAQDLVAGAATSNNTDSTLTLGLYCWRLEYFGDDAYTARNVTNGSGLCFTTVKQTPNIAIIASPNGTGIVPGTALYADANFTSLPRHPIPNGTASFFLCRDFEFVSGVCSSTGGNQVGDPAQIDSSGFATSPAPPRLYGLGGATALDATRYYIGAPDENASASNTATGSVYAFDRATGKLLWKVSNPSPSINDRYGDVLAVGGGRVFVGAPNDVSSAGRVYVLDAATGGAIATLVAPSSVAGDQYGAAIATGGTNVLIGAPGRSPGGAVFLYDISSLTLLLNKPNPDGSPAGDAFGSAVALSPSGTTLYVGLPAQDGTNTDEGSVMILTTSGVLSATIPIPASAASARFGSALNVTSAGDVLATATGTSRAWRFPAAGGAQLASYTDPAPLTAHVFGRSIASGGGLVLIGAPGDSDGKVQVYALGGGFTATLTPPNSTGGEQFGRSVAADSTILVTGAPGHMTGAAMGAAHAYALPALTRARTFVDVDKGAYCWRVAYSGDSFYNPTTGSGTASAACLAVDKVTPTIESVSMPGGQIALDQNVTDFAILFGGNNAPIPTGTTTFTVCYPWDVTVNVGCTASMTNATLVSSTFVATDGTSSSTIVPRFANGTGSAIASDGDVLAIGAPLNASSKGTVHVHSLSTGKRTFSLFAPNPNASDTFGYAVAVQGNRVAVGAPGNDTASGAVFLYDATSGALVTTITNSTRTTFDRFGNAVAFLSNGNLAIGSPGNLSGNSTRVGGVQVYTQAGALVTALISPSNTSGDTFGASLATLGTNVLIGAPTNNTNNVSDSGGVYYFSGTTGILLATLPATTPAASDNFGAAVASTGTDLIAGAPGRTSGTGVAYRFSTAGALLTTYSNPTPAATDRFGAALAANATNVMIGAPFDDTGATDQGAAYSFTLAGSLSATLTNASAPVNTHFGQALASTSTGLPLVGAPGYDTGYVTGSVALYNGAPLARNRTFVDLVKGLYCWRVDYSGDGLFFPTTKTDYAGSCFTVARNPGKTTIPINVTVSTDQLANGGTSLAFAAPDPTFADGAPKPTGTIQFALCNPAQVTVGVGCAPGAGTNVGGAVSISAGTWPSPASSALTLDGTYCWRALFNGDAYYFVSNSTNYGAACFTVREAVTLNGATLPAVSAAPGDLVRATLAVTPVSLPGTPGGTATFYLCHDWELDNATGRCPSGNGTRIGAAVTLSGGSATSAAAPSFGNELGSAVAATSSYQFLGAPGSDAVYVVNATDGSLVTTLTGTAGSRFGAALATDGSKLVIGSPASNSIKIVDASTFATIASFGTIYSGFGTAVAIGGGYVVVGAPAVNRINVYNTAGSFITTFTGSGLYGSSLAVNATRLLVGAPNATSVSLYATGTWVALGTITGPANSTFGAAVGLTPAGLIVGVPDLGTGEARVYSEAGTLLRTLAYSNAPAGARVGAAIATNGTDVIVGAPGYDIEQTAGAGAATVFNASDGTLRESMLNPDPFPNAAFGAAVAAADAGRVLVGAPLHDVVVLPKGAAHLFLGPFDPTSDPGGTNSSTSGQTNTTRYPHVRAWPTLGLGVHCFRVDYSGDSIYARGSLSLDPDFCLTVKLPSTVNVDSIPTGGSITPGSIVSASAGAVGLPGRASPNGTVQFTLCAPTESSISLGCPTGGTPIGSPATLPNTTSVARSDNVTPTPAVGLYCWRANYSGDALYLPSTGTDAVGACFTTVKQPSVTSVVAVPNGIDIAPWSSVIAVAGVTGNGPTPSGNVTFYDCPPGTHAPGLGCDAANGTLLGSVALVNGTAMSPALATPIAEGSHCFRAEYAGSPLHFASNGTNGGGACVTIARQLVDLALASAPTGVNVAPWTAAVATLTATGAGPTPSGAASFWLCDPSASAPGTGCPALFGAPAGTSALAGGSAASAPTTGILSIGLYCYRASYAGDANYLPGAITNDDAACFTTAKQNASAALTTTATGPVAPFAAVSAIATLTGAGPAPTGVVTFARCGPDTATASGCAVGAQEGANKTLVGGVATSDATSSLLDVGTHCYRVTYPGDGAYLPLAATGPSACFQVVQVCPHDAGDALGASVAAVGDDVLVGLPLDSTRNATAGAACQYDGASGLLVHAFVPPGREAGDRFGWSVAYGSGLVAIGAPYNDSNTFADSGRVYLYSEADGSLLRTIDDPSPAAGDLFGWSLAFHGSDLLVGAPGDDAAATDAGVVHVFDANTGLLRVTINDPDPSTGDAFGLSLAVAGDVLAVGAPGDDVGGNDAGAAYRIDIITGAVLQATNAWSAGAQLGWSVALLDGRLVAGAPGVGEAYLYNDTRADSQAQPNDGNMTSAQAQAYAQAYAAQFLGRSQDVLVTFRAPAPSSGARFGATVLALAGARVAVGAPLNDSAGFAGSGAAFVFDADPAHAIPSADPTGLGLPFVGGPSAPMLSELRDAPPVAGAALSAAMATTASGRVLTGAPGGAGAVLLFDPTGAIVRAYGGAGL